MCVDRSLDKKEWKYDESGKSLNSILLAHLNWKQGRGTKKIDINAKNMISPFTKKRWYRHIVVKVRNIFLLRHDLSV